MTLASPPAPFRQPSDAPIAGRGDDGRIASNAWRHLSARFEALTFPRQLYAWDDTGIPVNAARPLSSFDIYGTARPDDTCPQFSLRVKGDGIVTSTLF